jgi:hypothetical protein
MLSSPVSLIGKSFSRNLDQTIRILKEHYDQTWRWAVYEAEDAAFVTALLSQLDEIGLAKEGHPINLDTALVVIGNVYLLEKIAALNPDEFNGLLSFPVQVRKATLSDVFPFSATRRGPCIYQTLQTTECQLWELPDEGTGSDRDRWLAFKIALGSGPTPSICSTGSNAYYQMETEVAKYKFKSTRAAKASKSTKSTAVVAVLWENKAFRQKMSKSGRKVMRSLWTKPAFRKKVVSAMRAKWADKAWRAKTLKAMKAAREKAEK